MLKSQYIDKRDFKLANDYIICETSGDTKAKTASLENFRLIENCSIQIKFLSANTEQLPTLSINGTTAAGLYYEDKPASPINS